MGEPDRRFSFRGAPRSARPGEDLLAALSRERPPLLRRSLQYHRPQGPFCGIGHCAGCLVRVNGRPNVRACRYEPTEGDSVTTENAWPSPGFDLLSLIGLLYPNGVDTLHGLRRPAAATPLFQRLVRRLAGTGDPPAADATRGLDAPTVDRACEVVVVGAGPAGRAVASALVAAGSRPIVLERALRPAPLEGSELFGATTAVFLPAPKENGDRGFTLLAYREPAQAIRIAARSVVVASGGYDGPLLFRGNDRPGVISAASALSLSHPPRHPPFRRAVVVGGGRRAAEVLERCGDSVAAVVAPGEVRPDVVRAAADRNVLLYPRSLLLGTRGGSRVRSIRIRSRGVGSESTIPGDAVILAHRFLPHAQLFFQAGARMAWRPEVGAYFPVVDAAGRTSVPGLFATGFAGGVAPAELAGHVDRLVPAISPSAEREPWIPAPLPAAPPSEFLGYYREILRVPGHGRYVACPCADVLLCEVEEAHRSGYRGIEVIKRYTSLGTGICQGRYCLPDALLVLSILENRPPEDVGYITQRPPVVVTPLAALAALPSPSTPQEIA